jgi:hypothetical protein
MGRLFLEHYENKPEYQGILFRFFCPSSLLEKYVRTHGNRERFIFHRTQFLALFRLALLYSSTPSGPVSDEEQRKEITARCLFGIDSLLYKAEKDEESLDFPPKEFIDKLNSDSKKPFAPSEQRFLINLLQLYNNHLHENLYNIAGRYKDMLLDIPNDPDFTPQGLPKNLLGAWVTTRRKTSEGSRSR